MSRRGRNNITGPSSALTSFLREHNITARHTYGRRPEPDAEETNEARSSPPEVEEQESRPAANENTSGYASDNLDESANEGTSPAKKKRKLTKAAEAKLKAKEKASLQKKKGKVIDDDDDKEDEEEDPYKAKSKGLMSSATGKAPPIGTFHECAQCQKKFTVTKYTISNDSGFLCHPCAKSSGENPFKKPAPRKRKPAAEKRTVKNFEEVEPVKTLTGMCISIIGSYIDQVEELGDVGAVNMDKICRIVSKSRNLNEHNVRLFYDVTNTSLVIYDSTNLKSPAFSAMSALNPNLQRLTLHMCGQMESTVLDDWSKSFKKLTRLELHAPFLVREPAWINFIRAKGPQLTGFLITNSPRFTQECLDTLVESAPDLNELRLAEFTKMNDSWLEGIAQFTSLTSLDLSSDRSSRISLTSQPVIELLKSVGRNLALLRLDANEELDDTMLLDGVALHCTALETLSMSLLPALTDEGVAKFFDKLPLTNELTCVNFSRCHEVSSLALRAILKHSRATLQSLNINGCKEVDEDALNLIGEAAPRLTELDVGWCRNVNDLVIGSILLPKRGMTELKTINCFGCNRITQNCPKKAGVTIIGVETDISRQRL